MNAQILSKIGDLKPEEFHCNCCGDKVPEPKVKNNEIICIGCIKKLHQ